MTATQHELADSSEPVAPRPDPWIGRTIADKFRVDSLIGEGAMGRVYQAEQLALNKAVAVKVLHRHLGGDERIARRFHREARAASRLSHPSSLQIIDFGDAGDGDLYIAMELLIGDDLQAIIDTDAPLSPARIGNYMKQLLRALDEAHHAGIIHRDLKPENVIVVEGRDGEELVKVCDFGIAKIVEQGGRSTAITKDGYVCGTPEYMAPEQARGDPIDARSDIYSAGTVLYQMLCGRVPFTAENALGVITRHLMDEPTPPSDVQPTWGIPASLEAVALKALAKDPDDRFASAKDMSRAVARAVSDLGARANERLGHGSFLRTADEVEAARAKALADKSERDLGTRATIEHPSVAPPAGRGWLYALGGAFAVLAFGIYLWTTRTVEPVASPSPTVNAPVSHHPEPSPRTRPATQPAVTSDRTPQVDPIVEPIGPRAPSQPALPSDPTIEAPSAPTHDRVRPDAPHGRRRAATDPSTASAPEPPATGGPASALEESRALIRQGDIAGAIARLETAARAHPSHAQIQRTLGQAYMRNGDAERGVAAYRRYLELAPNASDRAIIERIVTPRGE